MIIQIRRLLAAFMLTIPTFALASSLSLQVLSATVKDQAIPGASVILQHNGTQSVSGTTSSDGRVTLNASSSDDANTLAIIKLDGYSTLIVKCPCNGMTYALSPVMHNLDGMRVVLTWGRLPMDLDSHLVYPGNHVYFHQKTGDGANLDVDDTTSYGPETITIVKKHFGTSYVYAVHDFSDRSEPTSIALSNSDAKVFVYVGRSLVRTYQVPRNKQGNLWTVFRLSGAGDFENINTMSGVDLSADKIAQEIIHYTTSSTPVVAANQNTTDHGLAKSLNDQGVAAYHAHQIDQAINLLQQATETDPSYAQAFANLGLAYQKAGRDAEAIWADRQAIALASGSLAATVRAGANYNIGRLYESWGQYADAERYYQFAQEQVANPVYGKAIKRVQTKQQH